MFDDFVPVSWGLSVLVGELPRDGPALAECFHEFGVLAVN